MEKRERRNFERVVEKAKKGHMQQERDGRGGKKQLERVVERVKKTG